ncbi:MAG TPA: TetR/AcrR family transcriptional regulator [Trebonia sp.]|jgi:AcrR family transcriptional regulator|nr:TetR/AcrR family transcriptional regulator [Trebonia sp.]
MASGDTTRQQLLDAAIEYTAEHGISDLSLRSLAAALGTSHRMLIFHFGSKEGLWVEIASTVDRRQRERLQGFPPGPGQPYGELMRAWWKHFSAPALWPYERLFFELYGQAVQGRPHTAGFLDEFVDGMAGWLEPLVADAVARGIPEPRARAHLRLGIAVTRGLLLDLLATGDAEAADQAMEAFIALTENWLAASAGGAAAGLDGHGTVSS